MPRCCTPIIALLTYFNHQGGRMRSLSDMPVTLLKPPGSYRQAVVRQRSA
jgi:hypothetical protein